MLLDIKRITWRNFLSYGDTLSEVVVEDGITLICGSNGSGKSTLLDVLCFCLYGKPFRKITQSNLVNSINEKDLYCSVELMRGDDLWTIERSIKPNKLHLNKNGKRLDSAGNRKDDQKFLEEQVLGINFSSFSQIVILGSANYEPFMRLSIPNRRVIIEDLLDIGIFSSMKVELKKEINDNKNRKREIEFKLSGNKRSIEDNRKFMEIANQNEETSRKVITDKISKLENDVLVFRESLSKISHEIHKLNPYIEKFNKVVKFLNEITAKMGMVKKNISGIKRKMGDGNFGDLCETCGQKIDNNHMKDILKKLKEELSIEENRLQRLSEEEVKFNKHKDDLIKYDKRNKDLKMKELFIISKVEVLFGIIVDEKDILSKSDENFKKLNIDKLKNNIEVIESEMSSNKGEYNEVNINEKNLEFMTELLSDSGIKKFIIDRFIPTMNNLINKYLYDLGLNISFKLDGNFEETITSRNIDKFTYLNFSEGEKLRIDLALLFAWRDIAKMRSSMNISLLLFDEVTDSSLDVEGQDAFLTFLRGREDNSIIISHNDQIRDKCRRIIEVSKNGNFSHNRCGL